MTWWFLIPIVAILVGGFTEWLKFKEKQLRIGNTTESLSGDVSEIESRLHEVASENERLTERIQNLETIVTTQAWDSVMESPSTDKSLPEGRIDLHDVDQTPETPSEEQERARQLARRLRH